MIGLASRPHDDPLRAAEDVERLAQPQVLRRVGERDVPPVARGTLAEGPFQPRGGPDGKLRGEQDERSVGQVGEQGDDLVDDELDISHVVLIDRRIEGDPDHVGVGCGIQGGGDPTRLRRQHVRKHGLGTPWRVILVAHSMGGIVARAALAELAQQLGFGAWSTPSAN